ncbi:MAG TPA: cation:proton antiporter [Longimicrobiaceae bacterium]
MLGIAILLAAAAIGYALAKALHLPAIPLLLLGGVALSYTGALPEVLLEDTLVLGVTFLVFVTGIELSPRRTRQQRRSALRVGVLQFALLGLAGFIAARLLGFGVLSGTYLALALTASSTVVIVRLLRQRRRMFEPYARVVVGVLLLQDMLVIVLVPILTLAPAGPLAMLRGVLGVVGLGLLGLGFLRWGAPLLERMQDDEETLMLVVLAVLFAFIAVTDLLALPLVVGAFFAGVSLSAFPINAIIRPQLTSIGDFFSAIFFTALGALIRIPTGTELLQAAILAAVVIFVTPPLVAWIAERAGLSARPALEAGLLLAQTSELSLVVGLYGMIEGQIPASVFTVIALVTLITMMSTPLLSSDRVLWATMRLHPVPRRTHIPPPSGGHVLVLGSGSTGTPLMETLIAYGHEVVVVDDDPAVIAQLQEAEISTIRGDATDADVLTEARARQARVITSTIRRPEDNRRLLEHTAGSVPVLVRVFEEDDAAWMREMGGTPVLYSEAAAEAMLEWYDREMRGG